MPGGLTIVQAQSHMEQPTVVNVNHQFIIEITMAIICSEPPMKPKESLELGKPMRKASRPKQGIPK